MVTPLVAQLIAEERIAAGIRAAETARLVALSRGDRHGAWARVTGAVFGHELTLPRLQRRRSPVVPCATC